MIAYPLKRLFEMIATPFGITIISFFIIQPAPGKPTDLLADASGNKAACNPFTPGGPQKVWAQRFHDTGGRDCLRADLGCCAQGVESAYRIPYPGTEGYTRYRLFYEGGNWQAAPIPDCQRCGQSTIGLRYDEILTNCRQITGHSKASLLITLFCRLPCKSYIIRIMPYQYKRDVNASVRRVQKAAVLEKIAELQKEKGA
jgi:hypothetical protein